MERSSLIFAAIIALAFGLFYTIFVVFELPPEMALPLFVLAIFAIIFFPRVIRFLEFERGVVFRFGRYHATEGPGLVIIYPFIDDVVTVDLRAQTQDIKSLDVVTKENILITVDGTLFFNITDPRKALTVVKNYQSSIATLFETQIRAVIARTPVEEVLENPEGLKPELVSVVNDVSENWGVRVVRVEFRRITLPKELENAALKRREAEEQRERTRIKADARKIMIDTLEDAIKGMDDRTFAFLYLEALKKVADGKSTKLFFPMEFTKLANLGTSQLKDKSMAAIIEKLGE